MKRYHEPSAGSESPRHASKKPVKVSHELPGKAVNDFAVIMMAASQQPNSQPILETPDNAPGNLLLLVPSQDEQQQEQQLVTPPRTKPQQEEHHHKQQQQVQQQQQHQQQPCGNPASQLLELVTPQQKHTARPAAASPVKLCIPTRNPEETHPQPLPPPPQQQQQQLQHQQQQQQQLQRQQQQQQLQRQQQQQSKPQRSTREAMLQLPIACVCCELSNSRLDTGSYEALSLRCGFDACMRCLTNGQPKAVQELAGKLASADDVSSAELHDSYTFIYVDVECAHLQDWMLGRSTPWDSTSCRNAIAQIAAVTADFGQQQQQQQQFNVYLKTPQGESNMQAAPEEAAVAAADKLNPASALQDFLEWALDRHVQHAGIDADPSHLVLVSHYGFCYTFSILVQHAEKYKVRLPQVLLADSCLWAKATSGMTRPAKLEVLADELVYRRGAFERRRKQESYALSDVLAMSKVVPRLYAKKNKEQNAAAATGGGDAGNSGGWKRELLALSTPLRHFIGRLGLKPAELLTGGDKDE